MKCAGRLAMIAFSPDGSELATLSADGVAELWDPATGRPLAPPIKLDGGAGALVFSPDGTKVAISGGGSVAIWDPSTGKPVTAPMRHLEGSPLVFSPDGIRFATVYDDGRRGNKTVGLWDAATGQPTGRATLQNRGVKAVALRATDGSIKAASIAFGRQGTLVAAASEPDGENSGLPANAPKAVRLWDGVKGQPISRLLIHDKGTGLVSLSGDGTRLVTAGDGSGKTVRLWDTLTGELLSQSTFLRQHELSSAKLQVEAVSISDDGAKVAIFGDHEIRQWDAATGKWGEPLRLPADDRVLALAMSPDGGKLAVATMDNTVELWNEATGERIGLDRPIRHAKLIRSVAFSANGSMLATASSDNTARLWDAATGRPLGPPLRHDDEVLAVAFSRDGAQLATVAGNNAVWFWPIPPSLPEDPLAVAAVASILSRYEDGPDGILHNSAVADDAWKLVSRTSWLDQQRIIDSRLARGWHENEAAANETADRWFAAAFHLRWLCKMEPAETRWQQRFANDTEQLSRTGSYRPGLKMLAEGAADGTWSPDDTRIAVGGTSSASRGIRLLTLAQNKIDSLTPTGTDPVWSRGEGRFVAFSDQQSGEASPSIWVVDLPGKQTKQVANGRFAGWLADGKSVCFIAKVDGQSAIQSLDVSEARVKPLTLWMGFSDDVATVSPDGQFVVGFSGCELRIWSIARKEIIDRHSLSGRPICLPNWSPEGAQVAFASDALADLNDLWIYDAATHQMNRILVGPYNRPHFSADGKRLCVDKIDSGREELWLLDLQLPSAAKHP